MNNYHTHTWRCHHAYGSDQDYVKAAIAVGIKELGFSDHTPWHYNEAFHPTMRMEEYQLDDYIESLKHLKEKYKSQISIKIGLECEYFPAYMPWLKHMLQEKEIDYIILGNHFEESDVYGGYYGAMSSKRALLHYVDSCIEGIKTGLYSYLAHPDLINYPFCDETYQEAMDQLCKVCNQYDIPLEYNLLGLSTGRHYPNPYFWKIAAKNKNKVIIGYDAHNPNSLKNIQIYQEARDHLSKLGLRVIDTIKFLEK